LRREAAYWAGDLALLLTGVALLLTGVVTELHPINRSLYKNIEY